MKAKRNSHLWTSGLVLAMAPFWVGCSDVRISEELKPVPEKVFSLQITDYCPENGHTFTEVFTHNLSSLLEYDHHVLDSDADGLSDTYEQKSPLARTYNLTKSSNDTNNDGYSDFLVNLLGRDVFSQGFFEDCSQKGQDTDNDGITDCEEGLVKTDFNEPDTDKDGIPDGLEVRFGTNALDPVDSFLDPDQDGLTNLQEIKFNTPINYSNDLKVDSKAYVYKINTLSPDALNTCYEINVTNIPVMNVKENLLKLFVTESEVVSTGGTGQGNQTHVKTVILKVPTNLSDGQIIIVKNVTNQTIEADDIKYVEVEDDKESP